jgi:hypothetical protein
VLGCQHIQKATYIHDVVSQKASKLGKGICSAATSIASDAGKILKAFANSSVGQSLSILAFFHHPLSLFLALVRNVGRSGKERDEVR